VAKKLNAPLEISEALREWDVGIYEGTTDPHGWELHTQVQEDWFIHGKPDSKMPGGESFNEIAARFEPFINGLVGQWGKTDKQFVLVAHGGLYIAMLPHIFTNIDYPYAFEHGFGYTACAVAEPRPEGMYCLSWP
jgi:broad specificity phosphatase PhoE